VTAAAIAAGPWLRAGGRPGPKARVVIVGAGLAGLTAAREVAMRGTVGAKDAARFQVLARQYLAQLKSAPVAGEVEKPAETPKPAPKKTAQAPKEPAPSQVAKGD